MKTSTLLLGTAIVLGTALSGSAMAHGGYDRGQGWGGYERQGHYGEYRGHDHRYRRHHHHEYREYRPYWREERRPARDVDSWYGLHLFLGGH